MALQIIDADQPLQVESIFMVIFGIPGIGKTSLAFRSPNAFLLDFDGGIQRSVKRGRAARVESWEDAVDFYMNGGIEAEGVKTLIIDTVGTMLDNYVAASVIKQDAKNAKKDGSLGLSGYGAMKNVFNQFVNQMRLKKVDVIFIAHDADVEEGGYNKKKPKVTGGSYDILKGAADLVGFLYMENDKRVIDFNPTDMHEGKNSAEFDKQLIPHYSEPNFENFTGDLIQRCKDKMNSLSEEMVEAQKAVEKYREFINQCNTVDELMILKDEIDNENLSQTYRVQIDKMLDDRFYKLFNELTGNVDSTIGMDVVLEFAVKQPKKYAAGMKIAINAQMAKLGYSYDKEAKKVVSNHPAPEDSNEAKKNDADSKNKPEDKKPETKKEDTAESTLFGGDENLDDKAGKI